jgi:hydrogenase nickel incorporation protein HypA/HybF
MDVLSARRPGWPDDLPLGGCVFPFPQVSAVHEASIVQALIEQVEAEVARAEQRGQVVGLELAIGRLSGVHVDAIRFAFEFLSAQTLVEGAELRIREPDAYAVCRACGAREPVTELTMECPSCGSSEIRIEGGQELILESIELEQP